ncbi:hypothetical protein D3C81_2007510 [compost metagenome]
MHDVGREVEQRSRAAQLLRLITYADTQRALYDVVPLFVRMGMWLCACTATLVNQTDLHAFAFDYGAERG